MKKLVTEFLSHLSQTFFVGTPKHGALLLAILSFFLPVQTVAGILCAFLSLLTARYLKPNRLLYDSGLFGMNGFFFGLALTTLFRPTPGIGLWIAMGAVLSAVSTLFLHRLFQHWQFPILVLPYMLSFQLLWLIRNDTPMLSPMPLAASELGSLGLEKLFLTGLLNSFSEIFFQSNPILGLTILVFLSLTHYRLFLSGLVGGVLANGLAIALSFSPTTIASGFWGFNGVLTAIALSFGFSGIELPKIVFASLISVPLMAAMSHLLGSVGLLALGFPYLLIVWVVLSTAARQAKPTAMASESLKFPFLNAQKRLSPTEVLGRG